MRERKRKKRTERRTWSGWFDRAIFNVFPNWGARRLEIRKRHEYRAKLMEARFQRAYEAADLDRLRGHKWLTSRLSPASQGEDDLETLQDRSEDLYRNDAFAASAINGRVDNVVGKGYRLQSLVGNETLRTQIEQQWNIWAREERIRDKMREAERCMGIYGECFLVMGDRGSAEKPVPLTVTVVHPRRVETPPGKVADDNVRMGVELDPETKLPVAYWVRRVHPHDTKEVDENYDRYEIDRCLHIFEKQFPGQIRGRPWLTPAMALLKDVKDFTEAHLISEQVAACLSVFITTSDPDGAARGSADTSDAYGRIEDIEPGSVNYLAPEEDVKFTDPNRPGNTLAAFLQWHLHAVAAAISYPYELLVKDYQRTTYSSGRLSLIDGRITFGNWQCMGINQGWTKVFHRFMDEAVIVGAIDLEADDYGSDQEMFRSHSFIGQGWPWVDPEKEISAHLDAIEGDLASEHAVLAMSGVDYDENRQMRLREKLDQVEDEAIIQQARVDAGLMPDTAEETEPEPVAVGAEE